MSRTVTVKVLPWLSEEDVKRIIEEFLVRLGGRVGVEEVREMLGIKSEELTEDLEVYDAGKLRSRERKRLS
ncbi:MAG: hypothetical protein DRJ63_08900 [Thermoprotei archaeon]|nr:MAG: hypothetical protein DRJ63_08900 [Thermoprotei archaeon]